jgi:ribosomal protein S18 acetylase RimI-like enzyme
MAADSWQSRQFDEAVQDLDRLRRFVDDCWRAGGGELWDFHAGDLIWQRFMHEDHIGRWPERVRLWERPDGTLAGFTTIYERSRELVICLHPAVSTNAALIAGMIEQAESSLARQNINGGLQVSAPSDGPIAGVLATLRFEVTDDPPMLLNRRPLETIPAGPLPEGFQVRELAGEWEYEERVSVHQEAFHPSRVTVDAYRRLREAPGYDPELDLVCVAPDGTFASYCIAWYDPQTRIGEFEPVGARAAYRRMGLTRAVMTEGMRRLQERGATSAIVACESSNAAACGLYHSLGFQEVQRWVYFRREMGDTTAAAAAKGRQPE